MVIATREDYTPGLMNRVVELTEEDTRSGSSNKQNGSGRTNGSKAAPEAAYLDWDSKQVCQWLENAGLKKFVKTFSASQVNGEALDSMRFLEVSDDPLHADIWASLGITTKEDKIALKRQLDSLFSA